MTASASTARPASRVTLATVAAEAGVSSSTASLAFAGSARVSPTTRERVLAAAERLGYGGPDPRARSLRRGRSQVVGVVLEDRLRDFFRDPMNIAMLDGLAEEVESVGSSLLLITDTAQNPADLAGAVMDGVVLVGCSTRLDAPLAVLRARRMPVVAIEAEHSPAAVAVDLDNRDASERLARHLRELGHERVAMITLPLEPDHARGPLTPQREGASQAFVASERIAGVRRVFPDAVGVVAAGSSVGEGLAGARELLTASGVASGAPRPTAILAQSDLLAAGALHAAEELGIRVPEELSIVGFDGVRLDSIGSRVLTTMVQPAVDKGRAAGRILLEALAGGVPDGVAFTAELRIGTTSGPAPRG